MGLIIFMSARENTPPFNKDGESRYGQLSFGGADLTLGGRYIRSGYMSSFYSDVSYMARSEHSQYEGNKDTNIFGAMHCESWTCILRHSVT